MSAPGGEKPEDRLKRIKAARSALAEQYVADPGGVERYEGRSTQIDRARKRERERFERLVLGQGDPRPTAPELRRPAGMSKQLWKAEADRIQRAYRADLDAWSERERRRGRNAPPAEQMDKAPFVEMDVNDHVAGKSMKIGRAFCRQPRFETFDWLTVAQIGALRRYRRAFDVSEMSPVKSGLDIGAGGGSGGSEAAIYRVQALAFADIAVQRMEALVPSYLLRGLRLVALYDADFKAVAIERFGSASGQRRTRVRHDFALAIDALMQPASTPAPPAAAGSVDMIDTAPDQYPPVDPAFLNDKGHLRPMSEIIDIIHGRSAPSEDQAA